VDCSQVTRHTSGPTLPVEEGAGLNLPKDALAGREGAVPDIADQDSKTAMLFSLPYHYWIAI
jgi:hypothetical protein